MSAADCDEWRMPETMHRCEACGRFVSDDDFWGDHHKRGCVHREPDHECEMDPEGCGVDACMCLLVPFCSEHCADKWHATGGEA